MEAGTPCFVLGGSSRLVAALADRWTALEPAKGCAPYSAQYRETQKLNWSVRPSIGFLVNCSGAMKSGVPTCCPVLVSVKPAWRYGATSGAPSTAPDAA